MNEVFVDNESLYISDVITPQTVILDLECVSSKEELIKYLITRLHQAKIISSEEEFLISVYEREAIGPTYMENFIAIPHGKSDSVLSPGCAFARLKNSLHYDTDFGGGLIRLCFLLAIPNSMTGKQYMRVLSRLARLLVYQDFLNDLYKAKEYGDVTTAISKYEYLLDVDQEA
jgi:PTS system fructose-specific IIA component